MLSRRSILVGVPTLAAAGLVAPSLTATATAAALPQQSPIDIVPRASRLSPGLPGLVVDYPREVDLTVRYVSRDADDPTGCTTRGREETIEAEVPPGLASVRLGTTRYELVQFHFHTPSEHLLDGRRFPLEQHLVHRGPDGELLVIGLFLLPGGSGGSVQDRVLTTIPVECGEEVEVADADLTSALPPRLPTFRYPGSLTTSPNTEGVSWLVVARPKLIGRSTITSFQQKFPDGDSRDPQPLNGRVVRFRLG